MDIESAIALKGKINKIFLSQDFDENIVLIAVQGDAITEHADHSGGEEILNEIIDLISDRKNDCVFLTSDRIFCVIEVLVDESCIKEWKDILDIKDEEERDYEIETFGDNWVESIVYKFHQERLPNKEELSNLAKGLSPFAKTSCSKKVEVEQVEQVEQVEEELEEKQEFDPESFRFWNKTEI